jgi:hypothetical protein
MVSVIIYIVMYPGFAWVKRGVSDLMFDGYNSSKITIWHSVIFFWLDIPWELISDWTTILPRCTPSYYFLLIRTPLYSFSSPDCVLLYFLGTYTTENTVFCCQECVFIVPLPSSGCPSIVESVTSECVYRVVYHATLCSFDTESVVKSLSDYKKD